jgi:hypothetical protein
LLDLSAVGGEGFWGAGLELLFDGGEFLVVGEVCPLVGVFADVIEFFRCVFVADVTPVLVDDGVGSRAHVGKEDIAVGGGFGTVQSSGYGGAFEAFHFWQDAEIDEGGIHVDEADGGVDVRVFGNARASPDEGDIGGALPECVFSPVSFFAVVVAVIAPEDDDGVVPVTRFFRLSRTAPIWASMKEIQA